MFFCYFKIVFFFENDFRNTTRVSNSFDLGTNSAKTMRIRQNMAPFTPYFVHAISGAVGRSLGAGLKKS